MFLSVGLSLSVLVLDTNGLPVSKIFTVKMPRINVATETFYPGFTLRRWARTIFIARGFRR